MSKIKGRNGYKPLLRTSVNLQKLKYQEEDMEKLSKDKEKEKTKEKLKKIKEEIEIQNLFTIQQRKCKELDEMVELITNIYKNNKKSYTTSKGLTNDIMKLKDIVQKIEGNPDIKEAVDNLDKSIKGEKKEGKKEEEEEEDGTTTTVQTGLSTSYLMIQSAIIKYAQTIKCPKKEESLDDIINYFYEWTQDNREFYFNLWKKSENKSKDNWKMSQIIFPLYIITKIILCGKLYNSSGKRVKRADHSFTLPLHTKNLQNNYLNPHSSSNSFSPEEIIESSEYLKKIFIPFSINYLKGEGVMNAQNELAIRFETIKPKSIWEKYARPDLIEFINYFERLLIKLYYIEEENFNEHKETGNNKKIMFKNHFYESILNQKNTYVGPYFSFGSEIKSGINWNKRGFPEEKGFRTFFETILRRQLTGVNNFPKYVNVLRKHRAQKLNKLKKNKTKEETDKVQRLLGLDKTQNKGKKKIKMNAWEDQKIPPPPPLSERKISKKNKPSPPGTPPLGQKPRKKKKYRRQTQRKKSNTKTPRQPKGTTRLENKFQDYMEGKLESNNDTNLKANKFGGKKKKHTKRNKKRHNKNKYTKKNK